MGPSGSVSTPPPCLELASRNPSWQAVSAPPSTGRTYDRKRSDPLAAPPLASRGPSTYGSRLARAYRHRAQNRRRGARLAGTREGRREDAPRHALGGGPSALPRNSYSPCQTAQSSSFPRRVAAPGFCFSLFHPPDEGRAERRKAQYFRCRARDARPSTPVEARRASSGTRSPLGAPPWRFSVGGRASISGISSGFVQRAPRSQVVVPGGRGPEPPGADGYEPRPQDATPRSAFGTSPETAPQMSEDK